MNKDIIEKFLSGELDDQQTHDLLNWVEKSKSNSSYFARIKNLWVAAHLENENPTISVENEYARFRYKQELKTGAEAVDSRESIRSIPMKRCVWFALRIAAIIILLYSIGGTITYIEMNSRNSYTEVSTKRGEKTYLALADGTRIWLNSETSLRYPSKLDGKKVKVFLNGEAYFDVAKNPKRKFIVNTASIDIAVLGTSFNVKSYSADNTIETTLEEGKISITGKMGEFHIKEPLVLLPNQQATFIKDVQEYNVETTKIPVDEKTEPIQDERETNIEDTKRPEILHSEKIDSKLYTSWKDGKMIFKSERFKDVTQQMERWYDMKIEITNEELKDIRYTGVFEKETIEQALNALSLSFPFHYEINLNQVIIRKSEI